MQIFNVRFGLATNSSSSHSLIFLPKGVQAEDYKANGEFQWGHFTAASSAAKMRYLAVFLRDRLSWELPSNIADLVLQNWIGDIEMDEDDSVDHQSHYFLPFQFGTEIPDEEFFKALKEYFLSENLVVLGGNDNTENNHPLAESGEDFTLPLPRDASYQGKFNCRYDDKYDFWTIFDQVEGTKIRFRLTVGEISDAIVPKKASTPELIDIKITNFCPFACDFCYQGSTIKGVHADMGYELYDALYKMKVFEVAIGGGEPTMHPEFVQILKNFRDYGIVPNFTTRNLGWLRNPKMVRDTMDYCGAFAYSAQKEKEILDLRTLVDYNEIEHNRVNIHIVMGTINRYDFNRLLRTCSECEFRATLLGFKSTGFGADFQPQNYDWWLENVLKLREDDWNGGLAIDTVLAEQYEKQILEADVPSYLFHTQDGKFSCYIDMVEGKIGPSSYCSPEEMVPLKEEIPEEEREDPWGRRCKRLEDVVRDNFASF